MPTKVPAQIYFLAACSMARHNVVTNLIISYVAVTFLEIIGRGSRHQLHSGYDFLQLRSYLGSLQSWDLLRVRQHSDYLTLCGLVDCQRMVVASSMFI